MSRSLLLVCLTVAYSLTFMTGAVLANEVASKDSAPNYSQRDLKPLDIGSIVMNAADKSGSGSTKSANKKKTTKVTSSKDKTKKLSGTKTSSSKKAGYKKSTTSKKSSDSKWKSAKKSASQKTSKKSPSRNKKPTQSSGMGSV
jgi:hypothetical protein